ncbi:MAG: MBL fold metallo-hydrolase [Elusimicrobiota bacterium]
MENFTYMLSNNDCFIVIDPSWGFNEIVKYAQEKKKKLSAIFLTHGHFDHFMDTKKIISAFKDICVYICEKDLSFLDFKYDFKYVCDEQNINICGIDIKVIHTPGHSEGSVCYLVGNNLFSGDTLFAGVCGRVDLPHSDPEKMRKSLIKLSNLSDDIIVWPGHDYERNMTTIGREKKENIFIKYAPDKDRFLSIAL